VKLALFVVLPLLFMFKMRSSSNYRVIPSSEYLWALLPLENGVWSFVWGFDDGIGSKCAELTPVDACLVLTVPADWKTLDFEIMLSLLSLW